MDSQIYHSKRQRTQRGVSLIEVLVVLVILVTGILTIIRLFPSGFFSIQSTGNAALANSLGSAAIDLGAQNAENLPDAIVPDDLMMDDLPSAVANAAAYSNYDPDNPNNLENARVVLNETVTVPTVASNQSLYIVKYGPVAMPISPSSTMDLPNLPHYFSVNSPNWTALPGSSAPSTTVSSATAAVNAAPVPTDIPQDTLVPGHEQFVIDLANQKIAVPYAAYTPTPDGVTFTLGNGQVIHNAMSYNQKMVLAVTYLDTTTQQQGTYTRFLDVPAATQKDSTNPFAPQYVPMGSLSLTYLPDTASNYHGGWFDPTTQYQDMSSGSAGSSLPTGKIQWLSATLYRPYNGVTAVSAFGSDPYQFALSAGNIGGVNNANPGVVSFNPKAATGSGAQARHAQISYLVYSWSILREDHDIPALTGGSTFAVRTAVPNLLLAGSANPDNSINSGIAGSNSSIIVLDLTTGQYVAPFSQPFDPTTPDKPINNEDLNGTMTDPSLINVGYALGRLTFGSQVFPDGKAHRIRIFYTADLNWAVAVQKTPSYFSQVATSPVGTATGMTPLGASQFAYDAADRFVYFARCNAGKTVEIDGTYTTTGSGGTAGSTTQGFSDTVSIDPILYALGDSAVRVDLTDSSKFEHPIPSNATVTFSAVRGLSSRSVVAWKERNQYKVHSVDAVLNRTP